MLFPGYFGTTLDVGDEALRFHVGATLDQVVRLLREQVQRGFCLSCDAPIPASARSARSGRWQLTDGFVARLPEVRRLLVADVQAAYEGDPAATSPEETIFCYPGILALANYRLAHELHRLGVPLLPRMITEHAHSITGIDIHPGAHDRRAVLHRPRHGRGDGRNLHHRRQGAYLSGGHAGSQELPAGSAGAAHEGHGAAPRSWRTTSIIYIGATMLGRITIGRGVGHRRQRVADRERATSQPRFAGAGPAI